MPARQLSYRAGWRRLSTSGRRLHVALTMRNGAHDLFHFLLGYDYVD